MGRQLSCRPEWSLHLRVANQLPRYSHPVVGRHAIALGDWRGGAGRGHSLPNTRFRASLAGASRGANGLACHGRIHELGLSLAKPPGIKGFG